MEGAMKVAEEDFEGFAQFFNELTYLDQRQRDLPIEVLRESTRALFDFIFANTGCSSASKVAAVLLWLSSPRSYPCSLNVRGLDPTRQVKVLHAIELEMRGYEPMLAYPDKEGARKLVFLKKLYAPRGVHE
jgi:hypothetical protein